MKKLSVYLMLLLGVAVFSSCEDAAERESSPEANPNSHKVYFPEQTSAIAVKVEQDTISIPIARVVTNGALTVSLKIVGDKAFSIPASVAFADGESETSFTLSVGEIELFKNYLVTLEFDKSQVDNPYVTSDKTPMLSLNIVREDYVSKGYGQWTDGIVSRLFTIDVLTYDVEVEYSEILNAYRISNPYASSTFRYTEKEDEVRKLTKLVFHVNDPDDVLLTGSAKVGAGYGIGIDYGYGEFFIGFPADKEEGSGGGNFSDGTIIFPGEKSLQLGMMIESDGKLSWWCDDIVLALPK